MAGRAFHSLSLIVLLAVGSSAARADEEGIAVGEPSPNQGQRVEAPQPLPKLLGFGKGADGTHAFLFARENQPPVVFIGKPGELREHEVLNMDRGASSSSTLSSSATSASTRSARRSSSRVKSASTRRSRPAS